MINVSLTCEQVWKNCLEIIQDNIQPLAFRTWFTPIVPLKLENNQLTIQVPSIYFYEWIEEHYVDLLRKTIIRELGEEAKLEYKVLMDVAQENGSISFPASSNGNVRNKPVNAPVSLSAGIQNPFIIPGLKKLQIDSQLNPQYSFDNYVEGDCNRLARSAGFAVAQKPGGTSFNPLMLYGGVGVGKTHLAQAIGNRIKTNFPDKSVVYVNAEKFTQQFVDSRNTSINDFVNFYQMLDVLILDDVFYLSTKTKTQDVFFQIFNHLHQSGKQIILTSDKPPKDLVGFEERLLSRFRWGLSADLMMPDVDTKMLILRKKMEQEGTELTDDVVEYVATNINTNLRDLEGALVSLIAHSTLNRKQVDLALAKQILKNLVNFQSKEITIDYILRVVCEYFELKPEMLKAKTRKREIVQARQICMYLAKQMTKTSLKTIGSNFGGRDHSTVIYACQTVEDLMETDKKFRGYVGDIQKRLSMS